MDGFWAFVREVARDRIGAKKKEDRAGLGASMKKGQSGRLQGLYSISTDCSSSLCLFLESS